MQEKRKDKRLHLEAAIELERLDQEELTTLKLIHVNVTDLSSSGMGFQSTQPMDLHAMYNTSIQIWTKETIHAVIRIVRCEQIAEGVYRCGARFVGLSRGDTLKINIYGMLNP
jgi:hypothetical protein